MGRERQELFRNSNSKEKEKIIILAFEGNDTEDIYFSALKEHERFNDGLIFLHLLKRAKNDNRSAPNHVFEKLKKEAKDEYNFNPKDELWMIIDTDRWKTLPEIAAACIAEGNMFMAVSNPCFELWLLLHIQDVSAGSAEEIETIRKNKRSGKRNHVDKLLSQLLGSYNKSNPQPERFLPKIDDAIQRAKLLDAAKEDYPTGVGTHVYKVVEKLIK